MLFSRSILVSKYLFVYVLSLLKSLNNRIIQILNLMLRKKNAKNDIMSVWRLETSID